MMMKAFDLSVGVFTRGLINLEGLMTKAEAHASATGRDPSSLLGARLAGDMYDLAGQAHWTCEGATLAVQRLLGSPSPPLAAAKSFTEVHERIARAIASLRSTDPDALEVGFERTIELPYPDGVKTYRGDRFLVEYAVPSFFFHLTTAYAILRHEGVPLKKGDFLGA